MISRPGLRVSPEAARLHHETIRNFPETVWRRAGGTDVTAIGPAPVTLAAGGVCTAVARDDGMGFNLIHLDPVVAP